jgi:hypothetical protein
MDVAELLAKYEIHEILMRCIRAFDTEEWDIVRSCFHPGAVHDHGTWRGSIDGLIEREMVTYKQLVGNFHFAGNELITLDGDTAESELYSVCWHRKRGENGQPETDLVSGMRYLDQLERRHGIWGITNRVVVLDWHRSDRVVPPDMRALLAPLDGDGSSTPTLD